MMIKGDQVDIQTDELDFPSSGQSQSDVTGYTSAISLILIS